MRIDLHYGPQVQETTHSRAQGNAAAAGAGPAAASGEDQTQLSGAHTQVQALAAEVSQLPEIREERVQALRQAVHNGQYHAAPEKIAGALVSHMASGPAA